MSASGSDGSIRIDTRLDNSGFTKGSNELRNAVRSLTQEVNSTSSRLRDAFAFDFGQPKQVVNSFSRAVKQVNDEIKGLGDIGKQALDGDTAALARFRSESNQTMSKLESMKAELDKFGQAQFETPEHAKAASEYGKAVEQVNALKTAVSEAEDKLDQMWEKFGQSEEAQGIEKRIAQIETLKNLYAEAQAEGNADKMGAVQDRFRQLKTETDPGAGNAGFDETIARAEKELAALQDKFETGPAQKMQDEVDKLTEKLEAAKTRAADMKAQLDATPASFEGYDSEEYEKDQQALQAAIDKLLEYRQLVREGTRETPGTSEWDAVVQKWQDMTTLSGSLKNGITSAFSNMASMARTAGSALVMGVRHPLQLIDRALPIVASGALKAGTALGKMAAGAAVTGLKKIAESAKQAAVNLGKMAQSGIQTGISKLKSAFSGTSKHSNNFNMSIGKGVRMLLKYGLGIRSVYMLVNKMRTAIKEGFKEIAKSDAQFNATVSAFTSALATLKNAFAAAFVPIADVVLPILTRLINALVTAMEYLGQFFSALTGKSTYKKAIPVQKDFANGEEDTAKNTDDATQAMGDEADAAHDLKKELMGFDDVNILHGPDKDNGTKLDKGTTAKPTKAVDGYADMPVDSKFGNLADMLKDMWAKADFSALGRMLGEKIRDALNNIPWNKIKDVLRRIAKSIATFLNGFLETPGLFEAIGRTLAEALNSAFEFLNSFAQNFHFASLGAAIGKGLTSAMQSIDWPLIYDTFKNWGTGLADAINGYLANTDFSLLGETLGNALNAVFTGIYYFVTSLDWPGIGQALKDGLLGLAGIIDWTTIYDTFAALGKGIGDALQNAINDPAVWTALFGAFVNGLNSILVMINNFVMAISWTDFGTNIGTGMNNAVEMFNWDMLSDTLINLLNAAFDLWYNWVTTFDFNKFGTHIGQTVSDVINNVDWVEGGMAVGATISGLLDALAGFVSTTDWGGLGQAVVDVIGGFFGEFDWGTLGDLLNGCVLGLLDFLKGALLEVPWRDIPDYIGGAIGDFLESFDWSEIASKTMELLGAALGAAIQLNVGLAEAVAGWIVDGISHVGDYFGTSIEDCGGNVVLGILKGIGDALLGIGKWIVDNVFTPFIDGFKEAFGISSPASTMLPFGGYIIEGLFKGIISALVGIATWIKTNIFDPFVDGFKSLFGLDGEGGSSTFLEFGGKIVSGLLKGITDGVSGIADWLKEHLFDPIVNGVKTLFGFGEDGGSSVFLEFGGWLIDGLKNGLTGAVDGIGSWIETNVTGPVLGFFKDLFGIGSPSTVFEGYGGWLIEGLKEGLLAKVSEIGSWIDENVTGPVLGFFKDFFGIGSPSTVFNEYGGWLMEGLENGIAEGEADVEAAMSEVGNSVKTEWDSAADNVKKSTDNMSKNTKTGFSDMQKEATSNTKTANRDVSSNYGESDKAVQKSMANMNSQTREGMHYISTTVNAYSDAQKKRITDTWMEVALNLARKLTGINGFFKTNMQTMTTTVQTACSSIKTAFNSMSSELQQGMSRMQSSFSSGGSQITGTAQSIASEMSAKFSNLDWDSIGRNICQGIYDGIKWGWGWLTQTAYNLAIEMKGEAERALGIASPSKEFYWIAQMMTAGLVNGIEGTKDRAIDAVGEVASDLVSTAEETSPIIPISAEAGGLTNEFEHVLDAFTNKVTSSFSAMIAAMEQIVGGASFVVPAVATGTRVPYSVSAAAATRGQSSDTDAMMQMLAAQNRDALTRQDLVDILTRLAPLFRSDFYLDGENLARHVNEGNRRLNRRYSATER